MKASDAANQLENIISTLENVKAQVEDNDTYDFEIEGSLNNIEEAADNLENRINEML